jgi:hypothetical protein
MPSVTMASAAYLQVLYSGRDASSFDLGFSGRISVYLFPAALSFRPIGAVYQPLIGGWTVTRQQSEV